jgi:hypothetical protein
MTEEEEETKTQAFVTELMASLTTTAEAVVLKHQPEKMPDWCEVTFSIKTLNGWKNLALRVDFKK